MKEENAWEKLGYTAWYRRLSALNGNADMAKPHKATIAYMVETNTYLTKRINTLEAKLTQDPQAIDHDPITLTALMKGTNQTWATVVAKPANPKQHMQSKIRQTQTTTNPGTPTDPTVDLRCLIICMNPPITNEEKLNGIEVRTKINNMLDRKGVLQFFRVMGISYSGAGNIKVTSMHSCKASNLMEHGCNIARIIMKNKVLSILLDSEHYRIKINKIPTWCGKDDLMTIQMVHEELWTYILEYKNMKQWRAP